MKTPQEIAKEQAEVMMAFAEGKEVQYRGRGCGSWKQIDEPVWDWSLYEYRIKPEPQKAEVTPGEWYWCTDTDDIFSWGSGKAAIVCCPPDGPENYKHWPANRHLLAAAKDLRDALQTMTTLNRAGISLDRWPNEVFEHARKALAKAKGESHE